MVHAENHDMIRWLTDRLLDGGYRTPKYHAVSHARIAESEATSRAIDLASSSTSRCSSCTCPGPRRPTRSAARRIWGFDIYGETCPQYLFLTAADLDRDGMEGAKFCCSPRPATPRTRSTCGAVWRTARFRCSPRTMRRTASTRPASSRPAPMPRSSRSPMAFPASNCVAAALLGRRRPRPDRSQPVRGSRLHQRGAALRPLSAQGHHRDRFRRGPRHLGPGTRSHDHVGRSARQRRLYPLRGAAHQGVAGHRALPGAPGGRRRRASRRARQRRVPALRTPAGRAASRAGGCRR